MILGHEKQWNFLKNSFTQNKVSHAYLFHGPAQLGKKKIALEFVKLLNCENSKKPCHECECCNRIEENSFPDLALIEPEEKDIKISQIRNLIKKLSLKPYSSSVKAAIIDRAHLMTQEAESALLKTIEEPKGNAVLILITSRIEELPKTLVSRTQKIKFYPVKDSVIKEFLEEKGLSKKRAEEITSFSLGRPGLAVDLGLNEEFEDYQEKIEKIKELIEGSLAERFKYAEEISKGDENLREILEIWLNYFRSVFLNKVGKKSSLKPFENYSLNKIKTVINTIQKIDYLINNTNVNRRLALEMIMIKL